jgi:hypothetical protein
MDDVEVSTMSWSRAPTSHKQNSDNPLRNIPLPPPQIDVSFTSNGSMRSSEIEAALQSSFGTILKQLHDELMAKLKK